MAIINDQVTQPFAMSQNGRLKMQHFLTKGILCTLNTKQTMLVRFQKNDQVASHRGIRLLEMTMDDTS